MCHCGGFESLGGDFVCHWRFFFCLFWEVLRVPVKSIEHVYTLRATTLEPVTGEINNMDHCVPMPCSAVKP